MNPDQPSREQIEARVTALLLGELPAAEAELLRWTISQDPELQKLHDHLKLTIDFVREAMKNPTGAPLEKDTPLKLRQERRETLLAHFKTVRPQPPQQSPQPPQELSWLKRIKIPSRSSLVTAAIAVFLICGLVAISIPNFVKARATSQQSACINNLRQIDAAKQEWALETHMPADAVPTPNDLTPYLAGNEIRSVAGEHYTLGKVSEPTVADFNGKRLTAGPIDLFYASADKVTSNTRRNNSADLNDSQATTISGRRTIESLNANPGTSPVTRTPAPIALPNTESSQAGSEEVAGGTAYSQGVVGYINQKVPSGAYKEFPNQLEPAPKTEPNSPFASSSSAPTEMEPDDASPFANRLQSQLAGAEPGPSAEMPSAPPTPAMPPQLPVESPLSPAPAQGTYNAADLGGKKTSATGMNSFGGGGGGIGGPGRTGALSDNKKVANGPNWAWSANDMHLKVGNIGLADGSVDQTANNRQNQVYANTAPNPNATGLNFYITNGTVTDGDRNLGLSGEGNYQSPFITREAQNAQTVSDSAAGVPSARDQQVYAYSLHNANPNDVAAELQNKFGLTVRDSDKSALATREMQNANTVVQSGGGLLYMHNGAVKGLPEMASIAPAPAPPLSSEQAQYQQEEGEIQQMQSDTKQLRKKYDIRDTDPMAQTPSPILSAEQFQSLNEKLVEQKALSIKLERELAEFQTIQATNPTELADVLLTVNPDPTLSGLLDKLHENEQAPVNAGSAPIGEANDALKQQIKDRVNGIMYGLDAQVVAAEAQVAGFTNQLNEIEEESQGKLDRGQDYWIARAQLQNKEDLHKMLGEKIAADVKRAGEKPPPPPANAPIPQPEIQTSDNAFSTFSLNVSDVSFKLAMASLQKGQMPDPASIRSEEFINAFDYHDPEPLQGEPLAFVSERAADPFAQERDLLRFSIKAAAAGRQNGRALNLVLLLDTSGSMERADRVAIIREALRVLSAQLQPQDVVSVVTFARTARLWADGIPGDQAGATLDKVGSITPEGGTNLEEAMRLAYETALRHFIAGGMNRVVMLTDGAANLGNVDPQALTQKVDAERRQGIALDCFGIGWDDYNDDLLEQLSSNGDGRYAFINSPDEAATEFAAKLAGALQVAAEDVKVQVEFNPNRVTAWRQIGYAKHQLTKQQFRDNSVAAGAIAAREAGNALYAIETNPNGEGPIATVRVRYRVPGTQDVHEKSWLVDYAGTAPELAQSSAAMRLAVTAAEISEWMADSPFAQNVTPDALLNYLSGVPQFYDSDERPKQLEWMIREAKSVSGK